MEAFRITLEIIRAAMLAVIMLTVLCSALASCSFQPRTVRVVPTSGR